MTVTTILTRLHEEGPQTLGHLRVYDGVHEKYMCCILEPSWQWNQPSVSCIPEGTYQLVRRASDKYGAHFHIQGLYGDEVPGRSLILLHHGNYRKNTRGCMLPGAQFTDIDGDGYRDVNSSKNTLQYLLQIIPNRSLLKVVTLPTELV